MEYVSRTPRPPLGRLIDDLRRNRRPDARREPPAVVSTAVPHEPPADFARELLTALDSSDLITR